jgi:CheY-like chemotaxis protein
MARVLIVEDDATARYALRRVVEMAEHTVAEAADGAAALELLRWCPADVIVTDLVMPEKDGIETIEEVRQRYPDIPILAYTGRIEQAANYLQLARHVGAHRTLQRPFTNEVLLASIDELLKTRKGVASR